MLMHHAGPRHHLTLAVSKRTTGEEGLMPMQMSVSERRLLGWLLTVIAIVLLWNIYTLSWR